MANKVLHNRVLLFKLKHGWKIEWFCVIFHNKKYFLINCFNITIITFRSTFYCIIIYFSTSHDLSVQLNFWFIHLNFAKFCDILHYRVNMFFYDWIWLEGPRHVCRYFHSFTMMNMVMIEFWMFVFVPLTMPINSSSRRSNWASLSKS